MRNKMILVLCLIILVTWGCGSNVPSKDVFPETYPNVQDNGKNLVWINTLGYEQTKTMLLIQKWIDDHPQKRVVAFSTNQSDRKGWLMIYENRWQTLAGRQDNDSSLWRLPIFISLSIRAGDFYLPWVCRRVDPTLLSHYNRVVKKWVLIKNYENMFILV